jgi:hypothetical protein
LCVILESDDAESSVAYGSFVRTKLALAGIAVAALGATGATGVTLAARSSVPSAFVGVDYYNTDCVGGPNLLKDAADPTLEREQLYSMHASGLNSLRYTINYTSDASLINRGHGGAIAIDPDGTMGEPYRSRFIRYLTDAKEAGFADVTIAFYPYGPNSPEPWWEGWPAYEDIWDPSLYAVDWRFVQDVRALTKLYGPPESHFDLIAEGPPSDGDRTYFGDRLDRYIERLYSDYVDAYGNDDVFFTAIGDPPEQHRLEGLIADLRATGRPLPQWWGLDIAYTGAEAYRNLTSADMTLRAYDVDGSIALGETAYENTGVASAVQSFNATAAHKVVQVEEYPNWGEPNCWSAPYTGDAYLRVLGIEPGPLLGRVDASGKPTLTTSDGSPVKALKAGRYTLVVTDASRKAGFRISGPGFRRQTTARFRGTVTWTINLSAGYGWKYASVGRKVRWVGVVVLT